MEADRLLYVISEILDDFEQQEIVAKMTAVDQALKQLAQTPTTDTEESFRSAVEQLQTALSSSTIDELVPSCQRIRQAVGAEKFTGSNLRDQIESMFNVAPFLAASIQKKFASLATNVNELVSNLKAGKDAIEELGIEPYKLPRNEFELGLLFPDNVIGSSLDDLLKQLKEWNDTLRSLAEAMKGAPGTVAIRAASTGSFDLFISIDAEGALVLGTIIIGIHTMFTRLQVAKERRQQLKVEGYSSETLREFDKDLQRIEKEELELLTELVIKKYPKQDEGRKRELLTFLKNRIGFIADSVREGVDIEVSVSDEAELTPSKEQVSEPQLSHVSPAMRRAISAASHAIADERAEHEKNRNQLPSPDSVESETPEIVAVVPVEKTPEVETKKPPKAVKASA